MKTNSGVRPLTSLMISKLAECWHRQKESKSPCLPKDFNTSLPGLYKRKFIDVRPAVIDGREIECVFITQAGIEYLESLNMNSVPKNE